MAKIWSNFLKSYDFTRSIRTVSNLRLKDKNVLTGMVSNLSPTSFDTAKTVNIEERKQ